MLKRERKGKKGGKKGKHCPWDRPAFRYGDWNTFYGKEPSSRGMVVKIFDRRQEQHRGEDAEIAVPISKKVVMGDIKRKRWPWKRRSSVGKKQKVL